MMPDTAEVTLYFAAAPTRSAEVGCATVQRFHPRPAHRFWQVLAALLLVWLGLAAPAAVELAGQVGANWSRVVDGPVVAALSLQPSLTWRSTQPVTPIVGICAGPVWLIDRDTAGSAVGGEIRGLAGIGVGGPVGLRGEVLASWGGGWWNERHLAEADRSGTGRSHGIDAIVTWPIATDLRVGPAFGWIHRDLPDLDVVSWSGALVVVISLSGGN